MMEKRVILYVVEDVKTAQFRYRVKNIVEVLSDSKKWEARWVLANQLERVDLKNVSVLVILRQTGKNKDVLNLMNIAKERGIEVLFDLDDLIFDYSDLPALMEGTNSKNIFYWVGYVFGIRKIARRVDGFITTNKFLAEKLKRTFSKPCAIIPNSLNKTQVEIAEKCLKDKKHKGFKIGYFSGSPTHKKDLEMIEGQLEKFLEMHDDVEFLIVGYMEVSKKMQEMVKNNKVKMRGIVEYQELMKLGAEIDVNIAPLVINNFTNCKSELKFFEAAAVETVTIASPTYAFKNAIVDGENGFLAKPNEWYEKLEFLYKNPKQREKIARVAKKYALENYYGEKFLKEVEEAYEFF